MPWPNYGQSAYGTSEHGVVAVSNDKTQIVPMASLAKIITAMAVLKAKPLAPGEQGPIITVSQADIENTAKYSQSNGTVAFIEPGEQFTERQALEAMLLPSANNIADMLANWAFESREAYTEYANKMLREQGISNTTVADASGFSPDTKSTAQDLVKLGLLYMQNPLLAQIAQEKTAKLPTGGVLVNFNSDLNQDGIVGVKIGYTDEAGRCFILSNTRVIDGQSVVSISVIMGAERLPIAMNDAKSVILAGDAADLD